MSQNMTTDCFSLGSIVAVTTCYDEQIEGQVMAFDLNTKLLILSEYYSQRNFNFSEAF